MTPKTLPITKNTETAKKEAPSPSVDKPNPIMIMELFRHGARMPINNYLSENWVKENGEAELTQVGQMMHYLLGKSVKESYPNLFNTGKNRNSEYKMQSTYVNRTVESAHAHLLGIYESESEKPDNSL